MKKLFKRCAVLLMIAVMSMVMALSFASCNDNDKYDLNGEYQIVDYGNVLRSGSSGALYPSTILFSEDIALRSNLIEGEYEIKKDKIYFKYYLVGVEMYDKFKFKMDGDKLYLDDVEYRKAIW